MVDKALVLWETEATSSAMMGSMFSILLCPKDAKDAEKDRSKIEMEKASKENQSLRVQATLLRAKLFQALNRDSEFCAEEAPSVL